MYWSVGCVCNVYGRHCPFLLCQAVFHLQACSYTYKCSNNTNNNLSLVQHFQTSSIHRQDIPLTMMLPLPLLSRISVNNQFCFIRRWKYMPCIHIILYYIHSARCQQISIEYEEKNACSPSRRLRSFTHFHSPLKKRENNFRIHSCLFLSHIIRLVRCKVIFIIKNRQEAFLWG